MIFNKKKKGESPLKALFKNHKDKNEAKLKFKAEQQRRIIRYLKSIGQIPSNKKKTDKIKNMSINKNKKKTKLNKSEIKLLEKWLDRYGITYSELFDLLYGTVYGESEIRPAFLKNNNDYSNTDVTRLYPDIIGIDHTYVSYTGSALKALRKLRNNK